MDVGKGKTIQSKIYQINIYAHLEVIAQFWEYVHSNVSYSVLSLASPPREKSQFFEK